MNIKEKTASLRAGELAVIYIGQAGFIISDGTVSVAVDPYLSYSVDLAIENGDGKWTRLYVPPVMPDELSFLDFVFISHDHLDHADPETISGIAAVSDARFVSGKAISGKISSYAGRDSVALGCKKVRDFGSFRVSALPAAHEEVHMKDGESEECGFLFDFGGIKIYHSGDSLVYDGLCDSVCGSDVMLLPVNGNGFYRREDGIVGNMDSFDAARLALDCGTGLLIPMHFDLYRGNSVPESAVRDIISAAAPSVRTVFPKPGEGYRISRGYAGLEVSPL